MGLTRIRAEQISDIDYKQAVRVITLSNVTLSGSAPSTVDGVNLSAGDRVLVNGQNTGSQNGLYIVQTVGAGSNGTWIRSDDANVTGEIEAGMIVMVTEGNSYKDTQWKLTTNNPIIVGTTALMFEQNSAFAFGNIYANGTAVLANSVGDTVTFTAGDNIEITGNNTSKTVTIGVTGISLNSIANGTSNVKVVSSGGDVTMGVGGVGNVAVFNTEGLDVTGNVAVSGNVSATYYIGDGSYLTGLYGVVGQYFFANTVSSVSPYYQAVFISDFTAGTIGTATVTVSNTPTLLVSFLTNTGFPNQTYIPVGVINFAYETQKTLGASTYTTYAEIYKRTTGDTETLLLTSDVTSTSALNTLIQQSVSATNSTNIPLNVTDRIAVKIYAQIISGANSNVTVRWDAATSAGFNLPAPPTSITQFIPYQNAVANVDLGSFGITAGYVSATGNVTGANVVTGGWVTATGNVTGGNVTTAGLITATGNVVGGNLTTTGAVSATGNITGGNILTVGLISATGNITGGNILGNGASLSGINAFSNIAVAGGNACLADSISDTLTLSAGTGITLVADAATDTITIAASGSGESIFATGGDMALITDVVIASEDLGLITAAVLENYDLGSIVTSGVIYPDLLFVGDIADLFILGGTNGQYLGTSGSGVMQWQTLDSAPLTGNLAGNIEGNSYSILNLASLTTTGAVSATGNISGASLTLTGGVAANGYIDLNNGTSNVHLPAANGNVHFTVAGNSIIRVTATGIVNDMGNGVGNIGNSTGYFNTIFAKATSAQYADLAEKYLADQQYSPGTVLVFGGDKEVTISNRHGDTRVAGVVSTNPSYVMNATLEGNHTATIALTGRVPTLVQGPVNKGDLMISAPNGHAVACNKPEIGTVIGKSLENLSDQFGIIEIVVGVR